MNKGLEAPGPVQTVMPTELRLEERNEVGAGVQSRNEKERVPVIS